MVREAGKARPASLLAELGSLATFLERVAEVPGPASAEIFEIAAQNSDLELTELIGAGGMGVVYLARDKKLDRQVALKVHRLSGDAEAERQLVNEAVAMARLAHPNIVTVYDVRELGGHMVLLMEYVPGLTLAQWLADEPRARDEILEVFAAAGDGLVAAHEAGLIHRDFKPTNVIVGDDGRVRVADFGLALIGDAGGGLAGTPGYMAPEQKAGREIDARADQYAFCVSLDEALSEVGAGRRLGAAITRGTADDPADRWPGMRPLLAELRRPRGALRWRAAVTAVVIACAGALAVRSLACAAEPDCADPASQWSDRWDAGAAAAIERALVATGRPFARRYARRIAGALDDYGPRWIAARSASCQAGQKRRSLCLDRRLLRVGAALEQLAGADADTADRAIDLIGESAGDLCETEATWPEARDPDHYLAIAEGIEQVRALRLSGHLAEARRRAAEIAASDPELAAELRANRLLAGDGTAGLDVATRARLAPRDALELDALVGGDLEATLAEIERADAPPRLLEEALWRLAAADPRAAVAHLSRAVDSRRSRLGEANPLLLPLLEALGARLVAAEKLERAEPHLTAALALVEQYRSDDRDARVERLRALAAVELRIDHSAAAIAHYRTLLEMTGESEPGHTELVLGLGRALMNDGQLEEAGEVCARARAAYERSDRRQLDYARARDCLGRVAIKLARDAEAVEHFTAAAAVVEEASDDVHMIVESQLSVVSALFNARRDRAAFAVIDRWIARANPRQKAWIERMVARAKIDRQAGR